MKILYHHRVGSRDGQAVHIDEIVGALRALGHEVFVVGPSATLNAKFGADAEIIATLKRHWFRLFFCCWSLATTVRRFCACGGSIAASDRCFVRALQSLSLSRNLA